LSPSAPPGPVIQPHGHASFLTQATRRQQQQGSHAGSQHSTRARVQGTRTSTRQGHSTRAAAGRVRNDPPVRSCHAAVRKANHKHQNLTHMQERRQAHRKARMPSGCVFRVCRQRVHAMSTLSRPSMQGYAPSLAQHQDEEQGKRVGAGEAAGRRSPDQAALPVPYHPPIPRHLTPGCAGHT
jgi:hypothetical protein